MKIDYDNYEYNLLVDDILENKEFKKLEEYVHHKTTRLEHSKRVSFYAYKICKKMNLDYISAARGGLLHDFFFDKYTLKNTKSLIGSHPKKALETATGYFELNDKEANIIESHMFPINMKNKPKYKESIIVSLVDKIACVYEKSVGYKSAFNFKMGSTFIYMFLFLFS